MPAALMTLTPAGAVTPAPTALILPFSTRIEPLAIVPCVTVKIVASLIKTSPAGLKRGLAVFVELDRDVDKRRRGRLGRLRLLCARLRRTPISIHRTWSSRSCVAGDLALGDLLALGHRTVRRRACFAFGLLVIRRDGLLVLHSSFASGA